jgi:hypothetical protein
MIAMSLNRTPAGVDTIKVASEHKFKTHQELKDFYKTQLAELQARKRDTIGRMRQEVLDLLEGSGVSLREIYTYRDGSPKQPKQMKYKLND